MLRTIATTTANLIAAAGLIVGLAAVSTTGNASAAPAAVTVSHISFVTAGTGTGGNTGAVALLPSGTVGTGGNVTTAA